MGAGETLYFSSGWGKARVVFSLWFDDDFIARAFLRLGQYFSVATYEPFVKTDFSSLRGSQELLGRF